MPGVMRATWYSISGVGSNGVSKQEFYVECAHVDALSTCSPSFKYFDAAILSDILAYPASIFRGLKRPDLASDGFCYCGKPPRRYLGGEKPVLPPPGMVFAVYVFDSFRDHTFVPVDWDWWPEDMKNPGHPLNWETDYEERVWPAH
jgi:hypothetical protein